MSNPWRDKSTLESLYHDDGKTVQEVADALGCHRTTVLNWMDKHGIERRDMSEALKKRWDTDDPWKDPEVLHELYVEKRLTQPEIAEKLGCGDSTVSNWIEKLNIQQPWEDADTLRQLYHAEEMSQSEIAEHLDCGISTVERYMDKHGIEARGLEESLEAAELSGENHYRWNGGHDKYYGPNWRRQREKRLQKDGHECVVCDTDDETHKEEYSHGLHVHHIQSKREFIKDGELNYERANRIENLITLCTKCHRRWEGIPLRPEVE